MAKSTLWYNNLQIATRVESDMRSRLWLFTCRNFVRFMKVLRVLTEEDRQR